MDTNATTTPAVNPVAVAMVRDMIASNDTSIELIEEQLAAQLADLQRRQENVMDALVKGLNVDSNWLASAANKVEASITERRSLYTNRVSLRRVLKAAGGE